MRRSFNISKLLWGFYKLTTGRRRRYITIYNVSISTGQRGKKYLNGWRTMKVSKFWRQWTSYRKKKQWTFKCWSSFCNYLISDYNLIAKCVNWWEFLKLKCILLDTITSQPASLGHLSVLGGCSLFLLGAYAGSKYGHLALLVLLKPLTVVTVLLSN